MQAASTTAMPPANANPSNVSIITSADVDEPALHELAAHEVELDLRPRPAVGRQDPRELHEVLEQPAGRACSQLAGDVVVHRPFSTISTMYLVRSLVSPMFDSS